MILGGTISLSFFHNFLLWTFHCVTKFGLHLSTTISVALVRVTAAIGLLWFTDSKPTWSYRHLWEESSKWIEFTCATSWIRLLSSKSIWWNLLTLFFLIEKDYSGVCLMFFHWSCFLKFLLEIFQFWRRDKQNKQTEKPFQVPKSQKIEVTVEVSIGLGSRVC